MDVNELIEKLDQRYGNPHAYKENVLIHEAIKYLKLLNDEVAALHHQAQEK
jgi:hypothetical protein